MKSLHQKNYKVYTGKGDLSWHIYKIIPIIIGTPYCYQSQALIKLTNRNIVILQKKEEKGIQKVGVWEGM